jgi:hypothetical protein
MPPFIFRCPNTGSRVQSWSADEPDGGDAVYENVICLACGMVHFVNPKTGKLIGEHDTE